MSIKEEIKVEDILEKYEVKKVSANSLFFIHKVLFKKEIKIGNKFVDFWCGLITENEYEVSHRYYERIRLPLLSDERTLTWGRFPCSFYATYIGIFDSEVGGNLWVTIPLTSKTYIPQDSDVGWDVSHYFNADDPPLSLEEETTWM